MQTKKTNKIDGGTEAINKIYTSSTEILDYENLSIQNLIKSRAWMKLNEYEKIGAAYQYVRDEVKFGYNISDDIPASQVLSDGYGQCNTKGNLLMALLRGLGISCRFHGFTIDQKLQKGAIPSYIFWLAPKYIIHSWVEVFYEGRWINLEGFILDQPYLSAIQAKFPSEKGSFCGYGVATTCLSNPEIDWQGKDTYIQKEGIHDDYGVYDSPDDFYSEVGTNLSGIKKWLYERLMRHLINWNVSRLRKKII
ncbi:transglutaminase-like domain-containing protein [Marinicella sp. S1101]|uniref:transglutaminase-like domain-containing protein n=1 Tax=Marinicella marina TaxID=2996016 RepID=UPI002260C5B4|nr:transglutaminase-like domain-containing protein [Marinicella marina]MCX7554206.1 transglutaminase-like domain-containing protein [Marinicella marina]MDJ1141101.1 transglutaminase-like domain-containing protein [Marinicella marina]